MTARSIKTRFFRQLILLRRRRTLKTHLRRFRQLLNQSNLMKFLLETRRTTDKTRRFQSKIIRAGHTVSGRLAYLAAEMVESNLNSTQLECPQRSTKIRIRIVSSRARPLQSTVTCHSPLFTTLRLALARHSATATSKQGDRSKREAC